MIKKLNLPKGCLPYFISGLVAIVSAISYFYVAKDEQELIKSIDYIFLISYWTFILSRLAFDVDSTNRLFRLIGWASIAIASVLPLLTGKNDAVNTMIGFMIFVLVYNFITELVLYKTSNRTKAWVIMVSGILFLNFFMFVSFRTP